jgi:hypothetical protein
MNKSEEIELKRRIQFLSHALSKANEMLEELHELLEDSIYDHTPQYEELCEYLNVGGDFDDE